MQPGNYLTEMLDTLKKISSKLSPADRVRAVHMDKAARSAICFQLPTDGELISGDMALHTQDLTVYGFARPPFDTIAIEYDLVVADGTVESVVVLAIHDEEENGVVCIPSSKSRVDGVWRTPAFAFFYPYKGFGVRAETSGWAHAVTYKSALPDAVRFMALEEGMQINEFITKIYKEDAGFLMRGYFHLCAALATREVTFEDIIPDKAKNQFRRARGKAPLFTYKVLTIGKPKRKSRHLGGTHASPRSHLRRGHYRTSSKGVRYWVQPCMVKGETDGFVHKDYRVEGEAA